MYLYCYLDVLNIDWLWLFILLLIVTYFRFDLMFGDFDAFWLFLLFFWKPVSNFLGVRNPCIVSGFLFIIIYSSDNKYESICYTLLSIYNLSNSIFLQFINLNINLSKLFHSYLYDNMLNLSHFIVNIHRSYISKVTLNQFYSQSWNLKQS